MTSVQSKRRQFRAAMNDHRAVVAPGVYDCVTARLVERAGFDCAIVTGAGVAASLLGVPDVGLMTMSEALTQTRNIAQSIGIPIVADCDTGYGNAINVGRTVREFEAAGVAALFIEDQVAPKRCGHFRGKQVISTAEMQAKIHAAIDARSDSQLMLIARTDALAVEGLEAAVIRARHYVEAGAEMLFVEAPRSEAEMRYVAEALAPLQVPLMINLVEGGRTPLLPVAEIAAMGYRLISFSGSLQKASIAASQELLSYLHDKGRLDAFYPARMVSLEERSELLGLPHFFELEERYARD